ncbi:MAG: hypothetical protein J4F42_04265 [Desulfurellaceae bacterium]|nr:hypothetical protein [Desulfurellaceae bacterium]
MATRLPIVGVMGSGSQPHAVRARQVGSWLAQAGVHLLTGGGRGVMAAVSQTFAETAGRRGLVIGIIPSATDELLAEPKTGYPNPWVEIPIYTHLSLSGERGTEPLSRNHINILSADVVIALPGGAGTASEVALALRYGRPLVAYLDRRTDIEDLPDQAVVENDFSAVQAFVRAHLP